MRRAMDLIHYVVKDGVLESSAERNVSRQVSKLFDLPDWNCKFFFFSFLENCVADNWMGFGTSHRIYLFKAFFKTRWNGETAFRPNTTAIIAVKWWCSWWTFSTRNWYVHISLSSFYSPSLNLISSLLHLFHLANTNVANTLDKDINGERRERERELMRSNSERDRSTNSHPRELVRETDQRDVSHAKYNCRGEVRISP